MFPPASKNVATGGPLGSNGNPSVGGSSCTPPLPPPNAALVSPPPARAPAAPSRPWRLSAKALRLAAWPLPPRPWAPPPSPWRPPRPLPRGGPLLARCHKPEKSGLPSAVRGVGAVMITLPCASRGTPAPGNFGHCAPTETEQAAMMARAPMMPESAVFTLKLSPDHTAIRRRGNSNRSCPTRQVEPGSMLIRQQQPTYLPRREGAEWLRMRPRG